jgi:hypothetical protein
MAAESEKDLKRLPSVTTVTTGQVVRSSAPSRQLADMPHEELVALAEEVGLEGRAYRTEQELVTAVHERRQLIASMNRDAMIELAKWGRRPLHLNATREQIAQEIVKIRSMRFGGLSASALLILAQLRNTSGNPGDSIPELVRKLKKQETFFSRLARKKRAVLGSLVSTMIGEHRAEDDYQFVPPAGESGSSTATGQGRASIKEDIEDAGVFGGIAGRIKKSADAYLNQKLDEIEARIDRKLDEIDRRLAEWRDKEIANRLRILKITLWASVIVSLVSLIYFYLKIYFLR